jgi:urate oxidase
MPRIGSSSHGLSRIRMLRVVRRGDRHDPRELTVSLRFEGDFAAAFREGRDDGLLPAETLKTLAYATAREHGGAEIERFALALADRVLQGYPFVTRVRVDVAEQHWSRLEAGGKLQGQAFTAGPTERRTATVTSNGTQIAVVAGLEHLALMGTWGFAPTATPDRENDGAADRLQRLVVGDLSARWAYSSGDVTFGPYRQGVRAALVDAFVWHRGRSVQQTLYAMADVVLATYAEITSVTLALHERPYRPADLFSAGLENPDELFVAVEEPLAVVEATVERES